MKVMAVRALLCYNKFVLLCPKTRIYLKIIFTVLQGFQIYSGAYIQSGPKRV